MVKWVFKRSLWYFLSHSTMGLLSFYRPICSQICGDRAPADLGVWWSVGPEVSMFAGSMPTNSQLTLSTPSLEAFGY
jgi:hypothetical protein